MAKDINTIITKMRKLVEHEQSAREIGSLNEANAFAAKIAQLSEDYRIEIAQLGAEEVGKAIVQRDVWLNDKGFKIQRQPDWLIMLFTAVARCFGCQVCFNRKCDLVIMVGLEGDTDIAAEMLVFLMRFGLAELRRLRRTSAHKISMPDFMKGFAIGLSVKFHEHQAAQTDSTTALVRLVDDAVEKFVNANWKETKHKLNHMPDSYTAANLGIEAGKRADLSVNKLSNAAPVRAALIA